MSDDMRTMVQNICAKRDRQEELLPIERIVLTIAHQTQDRIATGFLFTEWIVNRYGYTCSEAAADPEKHSDAIVKFFDEFDYDTVFPGIETTVVEAEILGCKLERPVDSNPQIIEHAIKTEADVERLEELVTSDDLLQQGRMPTRLELFRLLLEKTEGRYAVIATPMQPFPVAVQLLGFPLMCKWIKTKPMLAHRVVEACTQASCTFVNAFKDLGVHGITSIAAWNSVPNFSPDQLFEFDTPYLARMIQSVSPLPFIHYYWGLRLLGEQWERFLVRQMATGTFLMTDLAPDSDEGPSQDLGRFRELAQTHHKSYAVGLDAALISGGTPQAIRERVKEYIRKLYPCDKGCLIIPNAIPAGSPVENVRAFIDAINDYGRFPIDKSKLDD